LNQKKYVGPVATYFAVVRLDLRSLKTNHYRY